MALPACHNLIQFNVRKLDDELVLDCMFNQRSADVYLGTPYNISSYAILTHIFANILKYKVGDLIMNIGDAHLYSNHIDQAKEIIKRYYDADVDHKQPVTLSFKPAFDVKTNSDFLRILDSLNYNQFTLHNYKPLSKLAAPLNTGLYTGWF